MRKSIICLGLTSLILLTSLALFAQSPRNPRSRPRTESPQAAQPEPTPPDPSQQVDTLKIETNLVTIPVIATDAGGLYVADLRRDEFSIFEDGVKQNTAFFATVTTPFQVILMLDTSGSTEAKLRQIQDAALAFVGQLQPADRVKVISFDDQVRDLNEFTNDRQQLRNAILKTRSGQGTKLYDAVELALNTMRPLQGRRAIVLFTDGVDYHSDESTFDGTLRWLDEEAIIVYPIRYDTRAQTERLVRESSESPLPTIGVIRAPAPGTTAPTFPSDDSPSIPTSGSRSRGILGLPSPEEIMRRRREDQRVPDDRRSRPDSGDRRLPGSDPRDSRNDPEGTRNPSRRSDDTVGMMLDGLYSTADSYLEKLANKSGGRLLRADTLGSLPDAFAKIAAELRTQYSLGYYPTNAAHDGQYRHVKVVVNRKAVTARGRPGYRAPSGD